MLPSIQDRGIIDSIYNKWQLMISVEKSGRSRPSQDTYSDTPDSPVEPDGFQIGEASTELGTGSAFGFENPSHFFVLLLCTILTLNILRNQ